MTENVEVRYADLHLSPEGFAGVVVPYGEISYRTPSGLRGERFVPGAFAEAELAVTSGAHLPLWIEHDTGRRPAGYVTKLQEARRSLVGAFRCHSSPESREALTAVADGRAGLSVGFHAREETRGDRGERVVVAATLIHVALVAEPAYASARADPVLARRGAYGVASHAVKINPPPGVDVIWWDMITGFYPWPSDVRRDSS